MRSATISVIGSFNPRPSLLTDESPVSNKLQRHSRMFQSTSVIADGRIRPWLERLQPGGGFNPRPSLLTDESASLA